MVKDSEQGTVQGQGRGKADGQGRADQIRAAAGPGQDSTGVKQGRGMAENETDT